MGFLSPWFLAGLAGVALPVYIHLLRQYRQTPQDFSSLMFFERRVQSSVKHRRLRYLALLAMRLALIVLLALAFANPFINRTSAAAQRRTLTVIAIDRSFSMREGQRMPRAKAEAHRILSNIGGRAPVQVIAIDAKVENLTSPESDHAAAGAAIDSIEPDDRASSYGEFTRALRVLDQSSGMRIDAHLISDMQQSAMPANFQDLQLPSHTALVLHNVGTRKKANWAVDNVVTSASVYDAKNTRLTATVAGWQTPLTTRTASLVLDGKAVQTKEVSVPAGGRAEVQFTGFEIGYGAHRGEVRLSPADDLPKDDSFAFSVTRSDPSRVLFLYGGTRPQQAFFYKSAIDSTPDSGLNIQVVSVGQAAHIDFSKYAYVVLNDPGDLGSSLAQSLCSYVARGGAALIALGPDTIASGRVPLSSDRVSGAHQVQGAGFVDEQSPALAGAGKFENVQFTNAAWISPKAGATVVARLANGSPLLISERMGEGRELIFASTLDNSASDFPLHSSFVAFAVQSGRYLAGFEDNAPSVPVGAPVSLRHSKDQSTAADVIGPDGKHELSLSDATKLLSIDLNQAGFYEVQRADGKRTLVAAHTDRRESDLTEAPAENLDLWRNTGIGAGREGRVEKHETLEQQTRPWSLWRYALLSLLAVVHLEAIFANRYLKEERQTA